MNTSALSVGAGLAAAALLWTACGRNVLTYKGRPHFEERSIILTEEPVLTLTDHVTYNVREIVDEEFYYYLRMRFTDTSLVRAGMTLDLARDTQLVRADYGVGSVWNWEPEDNALRGTITIDRWTPDTVVLRERVRIDDRRRQQKKSFIGTRTFVHHQGW